MLAIGLYVAAFGVVAGQLNLNLGIVVLASVSALAISCWVTHNFHCEGIEPHCDSWFGWPGAGWQGNHGDSGGGRRHEVRAFGGAVVGCGCEDGAPVRVGA